MHFNSWSVSESVLFGRIIWQVASRIPITLDEYDSHSGCGRHAVGKSDIMVVAGSLGLNLENLNLES